jgi:hypothetical protein
MHTWVRRHRWGVVLVLMAIIFGWSAQVAVFALPISCAAMAADEGINLGLRHVTDDPAGTQPESPMSCEGMALRCVASLGCTLLIALPQGTVTMIASRGADQHRAGLSAALVGISLEPEPTPPKLLA